MPRAPQPFVGRPFSGQPFSGQPFIGSEALAAGLVNRHQLRTGFTRLFPGVYQARQTTPSLQDQIRAAWLWSQRRGVIAGLAAAALHGTRWVDSHSAVELVHANARAPAGVVVRRDLLLAGETVRIGEMTVTTPARTAFDLGRVGQLNSAVARVDALMNATGLSATAVAELAAAHPRARGLRRLEATLALTDGGAQSPRETWLRLLLVRAGLPAPRTQIPVSGPGGYPFAYLDLGWPESMVAVEYDGDHHRSDRRQYVRDIRRRERLERMGWIVVTVVAEDRPDRIVERVRDALERRSTVRPGRSSA